jgi:hypothetical protein
MASFYSRHHRPSAIVSIIVMTPHSKSYLLRTAAKSLLFSFSVQQQHAALHHYLSWPPTYMSDAPINFHQVVQFTCLIIISPLICCTSLNVGTFNMSRKMRDEGISFLVKKMGN